VNRATREEIENLVFENQRLKEQLTLNMGVIDEFTQMIKWLLLRKFDGECSIPFRAEESMKLYDIRTERDEEKKVLVLKVVKQGDQKCMS